MGIFRRALDSLYGSPIATNAVFEGVEESMRVIDKSDGTPAPKGPRTAPSVKVPTVTPAITIRDHEVISNGLEVKDLLRKSVTFNGKTWYVHASEPRPRPDGENETLLYIRSTR